MSIQRGVLFMKQTITIRIDEKLKLDFIQICETQGRVPSKVIRGLLESYVSTNHDNNISGNVDTNNNKNNVATNKKPTHKPLTHNAIIIRKKNGKTVCTYNRGEIIDNKHYDERAYIIKEVL